MTHAAQCQGATFLVTEIEVQMTDDRNQIVISELGKKLMNIQHRTSNNVSYLIYKRISKASGSQGL